MPASNDNNPVTFADKYAYILTRTTSQWTYNCYSAVDINVFLAAFSSEESALRHCIDECGMKVVTRNSDGRITLEPTRLLSGKYMPFSFGLEDDEFRHEYRLTKYALQ